MHVRDIYLTTVSGLARQRGIRRAQSKSQFKKIVKFPFRMSECRDCGATRYGAPIRDDRRPAVANRT